MTRHRRLVGWVCGIVCLVVVGLAPAPAAADEGSGHTIAVTDRGVVRGIRTDAGRQFLGVPYAAPPVGQLRWRPPQPHERWTGVRDATRFGAHCPQTAGSFGIASTNEDCLLLNVFTPAREDEGLPHR